MTDVPPLPDGGDRTDAAAGHNPRETLQRRDEGDRRDQGSL